MSAIIAVFGEKAILAAAITHQILKGARSELYRRNARKGKGDPRKLVLPEGYEAAHAEGGPDHPRPGFASEVTLLGTLSQIEAEAKKQGVNLKGLRLEEPATSP